MTEIFWQIDRLDDNQELGAADAECFIEIEGTIRHEGQDAGLLEATYLFSEEPETEDAFLWLWDLTAKACALYEQIITEGKKTFRKPIPQFLKHTTGILCIHYLALKPEFRRRGIGREAIRETVRQLADPRVGVVLIDIRPLQHRPNGYEDFFDEVRELPFNIPEVDQARLIQHCESWGMLRVPGTNFMAAAPSTLCPETYPNWYPGLLEM
jgi:GNAT superfamily N-acetyltransferase